MPEVVVTDDTEDKHLSVAYGNLVGVLIEAVKELSEEVSVLRKMFKRSNLRILQWRLQVQHLLSIGRSSY